MSDPVPSPFTALSAALADAVAAASRAVVGIRSGRAPSSGFVWRPGLVVTADEALAEDGEVSLALPDGGRRRAAVAGRDPSTDVALLRVDTSGLDALPRAAAPPRAGSLVLAVGAGDSGPLAAFGAVALAGPAWRSMRGGDIDGRLELDLRLGRRAEGGLALDAAGGVLGMAVFGPRRRVLVIPASTVDRAASLLERHGRIPRGHLGLGLQAVRIDVGAGRGLMVMSVEAGGPGEDAGVVQGDVLLSWDGDAVASVEALARRLGPDSVGRTVTLGLRRGGHGRDAALTVGERPRR